MQNQLLVSPSHQLCHKILLNICEVLLVFSEISVVFPSSIRLFSSSELLAAMSLEVADHSRDAPIPSHLEDEGFMYPNDHRTHWDHGKYPYGTQPNAQHPDTQLSKPTRSVYRKTIAVSSRFIVFWSVMFCLFAVLAVVAAGVAGSIAAKRGRNLNSWSVFHFTRILEKCKC